MSKHFLETALKIHKEFLEPIDPKIANDFTNLGIVNYEHEEMIPAQECFLEALKIDKMNCCYISISCTNNCGKLCYPAIKIISSCSI